MSISVEASSLCFDELPPDVQEAIDNAIGAGFDTSRKIGETQIVEEHKTPYTESHSGYVASVPERTE